MTDSPSTTMHVVATAGHVDHGKSTLVRTLTGTDPDRWAEEKARGLTIDLGFAHTRLASGRGVSFVDVPGHVRFLKNMLAGVGSVDACVFVVAATEGWKPQSEEHLQILELLGLRFGLIALTKVGLVDDEWAELARMDVVDHVAGTFLDGADVVAVDAPTGRGLDDLRAALDRMLGRTPTAPDLGRPRLWVDRVFSARGSGTVVTGTLIGGALRVDDQLHVRTSVAELPVRVRGLQSHGVALSAVGPGNRVAVNLGGAGQHDLARGDVLVDAAQWWMTTRFDASLRTLASLDHDVSRRGAYAASIGSGEQPVRVRILGSSGIAPGGDGFVRVHLTHAVPLAPGDRFILRDHGREETVGGGTVLEVAPIRPASKAQPSDDVDHLVDERGWVALPELARLTGGRSWKGSTVGPFAVSGPALEQTKARLVTMVEGAGALGLDIAVLDERQRAALALLERDGVTVRNGRAVLETAPDPLAGHAFVLALEAAPFTPPDATGVDRGELRELIRRGLVIERDGVWFAPAAIEAATRIVADLLASQPAGVTVAEVRDALGATRKHVLPLLAQLDATGITRRRGDARVAGPRAPAR